MDGLGGWDLGMLGIGVGFLEEIGIDWRGMLVNPGLWVVWGLRFEQHVMAQSDVLVASGSSNALALIV